MAAQQASELAERSAQAAAAAKPTVRKVIEELLAKHIAGKRSAAAVEYRLDRLAQILGDRKISEVRRQDVVAALDEIAKVKKKGRTAKQLSGETLVHAKRVWRFAETRE